MSKRRRYQQFFAHDKNQTPSSPQTSKRSAIIWLATGLFLTVVAIIGGFVGYYFLPGTADPGTRYDTIFGGAIIFLALIILPGIVAYNIYKRKWRMWGIIFLVCAALVIGGVIGYFSVPGGFAGLGTIVGGFAFLFLGVVLVDVGNTIHKSRSRHTLLWLAAALLFALIVGGIPGYFFFPHTILAVSRLLLGTTIGSIVLLILKDPKSFFKESGDGLLELLIQGAFEDGCGCLLGYIVLFMTLTITIGGLIIWLI
jgi:hypothetical protein